MQHKHGVKATGHEKGVHAPVGAGHKEGRSISEPGKKVREANRVKEHGAIGAVTLPERTAVARGIKEEAKGMHRANLEHLKSQKKPSLGKADKTNKYGLSTNTGRLSQYKNIKGVNKPHAMGSGDVGTSSQGYTVRGGAATISPEGNKGQKLRQPNGGGNYDRELAQKKAKNTLKEIQEMPKPNLGKALAAGMGNASPGTLVDGPALHREHIRSKIEKAASKVKNLEKMGEYISTKYKLTKHEGLALAKMLVFRKIKG